MINDESRKEPLGESGSTIQHSAFIVQRSTQGDRDVQAGALRVQERVSRGHVYGRKSNRLTRCKLGRKRKVG